VVVLANCVTGGCDELVLILIVCTPGELMWVTHNNVHVRLEEMSDNDTSSV
jgi:hypothetical protein